MCGEVGEQNACVTMYCLSSRVPKTIVVKGDGFSVAEVLCDAVDFSCVVFVTEQTLSSVEGLPSSVAPPVCHCCVVGKLMVSCRS